MVSIILWDRLFVACIIGAGSILRLNAISFLTAVLFLGVGPPDFFTSGTPDFFTSETPGIFTSGIFAPRPSETPGIFNLDESIPIYINDKIILKETNELKNGALLKK